MVPLVRYQVFVSSTYEDLREERQQATQAILEAGSFPSGMELFPASDDTQWDLIKRVIEECDYYIAIVAGRYGSIGPAGCSYTEMEYDYALSKGIPVLGFVRNGIEDISFRDTEKSEEGRRKLEAFRKKVMSRTCRSYLSPSDLGMAVLKSLMAEARIRPRTGWVRADQARSDGDIQRERKLRDELETAAATNEELERRIEDLEREIRDRAVLHDELPQEMLSQGEDLTALTVTFVDGSKRHVSETVELSWNEIFRVIGPSMYGYILWKTTKAPYGEKSYYPFHEDIVGYIRTKIVERTQGRKINLEPAQVDAFIFQFKELGLLMFSEKQGDDGDKFRGVTLTELGERQLTLLSVRRREAHY
jgi:hypothetical protein